MDPILGRIEYNRPIIGSNLEFETTATYLCEDGYRLTHVNRTRICGGDGSSYIGQWTGTTPRCERK